MFGCGADAGNNTANVVHNFDARGKRVYKINVGMSDWIRSSEDVFFKVFHELEVNLRHLLLVFYENLHEQKISKSVWLSYIQGFQGWGVGRLIDGEFVKYDGLSGNHVLVFQALDAFLGIEQYLTEENMLRYIPRNQRELCYAFRQHNIRQKLQTDNKDDEEIKQHRQLIEPA
ncbi:hypothetical protein SLS63_012436 [Diaporthe eres]|uniref:Uncharacterized protein n=1 Tax=Diaporthe eres TaxID=83184 RepID=A0ABR1NR77_DIAER